MSIRTYIKKTYENNPNLPFRKVARAIYWRLYASPRGLYRNFKPVSSTKPLKCNPASRTELHTLTCHDHVFLYITAIKSLLRFVSDLAVVVHDDGSLTTKDIETIEHHIVGIKVIQRNEADRIVGKLLAPYPKTASYRSKVINSLELTDHGLLAGRDKAIITNSDTFFCGAQTKSSNGLTQTIAAFCVCMKNSRCSKPNFSLGCDPLSHHT